VASGSALLWVGCYASYEAEKKSAPEPETTDERVEAIEDSAVVQLAYVGEVDLSSGWSGLETTTWHRLGNGQLLCAWQYVSEGAPSTVAACVDADGEPCGFAFDVTLSEGEEVEGDCSRFEPLGEQAGPYAYGYIEDYRAGGVSYGPALMFYYRYAAVWTAVPGSVTYEPGAAALAYQWDAPR